ncbi:hypothetical protein FO519_006973, partial [Halicephalobus sp. NKZ332]
MLRFLDYMNKVAKPRPDEDIIDSVNNRITVFLFLGMGLSVFAKEYYGNPIKCWGKPEWTSSWLQYAEDYCFVEGTFFAPVNDTIPKLEILMEEGKKMILLNKLIADEEEAIFGFDLLKALLKGINWRETGYFARVTICTFLIREIGDGINNNIVFQATQCVLSAQMIVEKLYLIVWHWLFFLQIAN